MKQRKNFYFCDFLEFMPDDENIILSDNDVEESNGGEFKNQFYWIYVQMTI